MDHHILSGVEVWDVAGIGDDNAHLEENAADQTTVDALWVIPFNIQLRQCMSFIGPSGTQSDFELKEFFPLIGKIRILHADLRCELSTNRQFPTLIVWLKGLP